MEGYYYNYVGQLQRHHPHHGGVAVGTVSIPMKEMWVKDHFFWDEREGRRRTCGFMKGQSRHHILHALRKSLDDAVLVSWRKGSLVSSPSSFPRFLRIVKAGAGGCRSLESY